MAKTITMTLNTKSIDAAIKEVKAYEKWFKRKANELCLKLAEIGATRVSLGYARAAYTGKKDISVSVEKIRGGYSIVAAGESVAFVEFGSGVRYGSGHPQAKQFGAGPGTYPDGKGHWDDPRGWWLPKEAGGGHTYGNPPSAVMYNTTKDLREEVLRVAKEVFSSD